MGQAASSSITYWSAISSSECSAITSKAVLAEVVAEALHACDHVIGLDLGAVAIDGLHKAPCGEGMGRVLSIEERRDYANWG
ncbi:MAG: hypothetical protein ACLQCU_13910 [Acidimicrobiales bacterium]|jgi:hypothetical protein